MSNNYFLTTTRLNDKRLIIYQQQVLLESYGLLLKALSGEKDSIRYAFAEPIIAGDRESGSQTASWYCGYEGEAVRLVDLIEPELGNAKRALDLFFNDIEILLSKSQDAELIKKCLCIFSKEDIWIVDDHIVIANWGCLPENIADAAEIEPRHTQAIFNTLLPENQAKFADIFKAPVDKVNAQQVNDQANQEDSIVESSLEQEDLAGATLDNAELLVQTGQNDVYPLIKEKKPWYLYPWVMLSIVLLVLLLGLFIGVFLLGNHGRPLPEVSIYDSAHNELIAGLRRRRDALRTTLNDQNSMCSSDAADLINPGYSQPVMRSEAAEQSANADSQESIAEFMEKTAVLVLTISKEQTAAQDQAASSEQSAQLSSGSGFLIANDMVVTNRHVIESAANAGKVFITSQALGKLYPATILAESETNEIGRQDFAVLKLKESVEGPLMTITEKVNKLSRVYTAGFPGYILKMDASFSALLQGDLSSAPTMTMSHGTVQNILDGQDGLKIIVHDAEISQGNSGGPLVDKCGRVVGINTFIGSDAESGRRGLFSLASKDLVQFLNKHHINFELDNSKCS